MTILADFQFELLPELDADEGQVFGIYSDISLDEDGFHPGSTSWADQNSQSTITGAINFGRDKLNGPVWAWDLHVDRDNLNNAIETLAEFTTAWRAWQIRDTPGAVIPLRYRLADRVRRIYGRPGQCEASPANLLLNGFTPVTCDFQAINGLIYDDEENRVSLGVSTGTAGAGGGGFLVPVTFPTTPATPTERSTAPFIVGGDVATSPVIRFNGPWISPGITIGSWTLSMPDYGIPSGQYVEIDLRPWANTVLLNGEASVAGALGRRQNLNDMTLEPGPAQARTIGTSETGTATCDIRWANAHNSL